MPELKPEVKKTVVDFITNVVKVVVVGIIAASAYVSGWAVKTVSQLKDTNVPAQVVTVTEPTATPSATLAPVIRVFKPVVTQSVK